VDNAIPGTAEGTGRTEGQWVLRGGSTGAS
jgi:hypothetical protein